MNFISGNKELKEKSVKELKESYTESIKKFLKKEDTSLKDENLCKAELSNNSPVKHKK
jgi:hypothetical protein